MVYDVDVAIECRQVGGDDGGISNVKALLKNNILCNSELMKNIPCLIEIIVDRGYPH